MDVGTLKATLGLDTKSFRNGLKDAENQADRSTGRMRSGFGKLATVIGGAFAVGAVIQGVKKIVSSASDLEESINAVNVTYEDSATEILKLSEASARTYGLSKKDFNGMAVQLSAFAKTATTEGGNVSDTLDDMITRSADFASVMNLEVAEATALMQQGLAGETEGLRRYGIDVSAAAVETYAYANGIAEAGSTLTEQEKIQARYGTIMEQTNKTAGDFANTSDSLANKQRIASALWEDAKAKLGAGLLPIMAQLAGLVTGTVIPAIESMVPVFQALGEAVQAGMDWIQENFQNARKTIDMFVLFFRKMLGGGGSDMGKAMEDGRAWIEEIWGKVKVLFETVMEALTVIIKTFVKIFINLWERFGKDLIDNAIRVWGNIQQFLSGALDIITGILEVFIGIFTGDWRRAWDGVKLIFSGAWNAIKAIFDTALTLIKSAFQIFKGTFIEIVETLWNMVKTVWNAAVDGLVDKARSMWEALKSGANDMKWGVISAFNSLKGSLGRAAGWIIDNVVNRIIRGFNRLLDMIPGVNSQISTVRAPSVGAGRGAMGFHSGGLVHGAGSTDNTPAMLTPGEFVLRKRAVKSIGITALNALNSAGIQAFHNGGMVRPSFARSGGGMGGAYATMGTGPINMVAEVYIGGEKIDERADARIRRYDTDLKNTILGG